MLFLATLWRFRKTIRIVMNERKQLQKDDSNETRKSKQHRDVEAIARRGSTSQPSQLFLITAHLYEKFDGDAWWFGVFIIAVRLFETR